MQIRESNFSKCKLHQKQGVKIWRTGQTDIS